MAKASRVQSKIQQQLNEMNQKIDLLLKRSVPAGDNPYLDPEIAAKLEAQMKPNSFEGTRAEQPGEQDETPAAATVPGNSFEDTKPAATEEETPAGAGVLNNQPSAAPRSKSR